jgi:hypothetical protein
MNNPLSRLGLLFLMHLLCLGCSQAPAEPPAEDGLPLAIAGSHFDPKTAGSIQGHVVWNGEVPVVEALTILPVAVGIDTRMPKQVQPNVNTPVIDPSNKGVANAVVFLRGVDPSIGRPWDHPPVQVVMRDFRFYIQQGGQYNRNGFVRRGEAVEMVSRQPILHMLHADGAAFFTLAFPDADKPLVRCLKKPGIVELSSASTWFWMRAYLFVDDHPYYACTDADGRFILPQVPPGHYQLVCWMPNWHEKDRDLDPELGIGLRLFYQPPLEITREVQVKERETVEVQFAPSVNDFQRR